MKKFNSELENVKMSPIVEISEEIKKKALEFEKTGKSFIKFQRGEIDFPTPDYIVEVAIKGLKEKKLTKYPQSGGEPFFKDAILEKLAFENNAKNLERENIVVTYGGMEALELSFKLFKEGAGFSPCWSPIFENFAPYSNIKFIEVPLSESFEVNYNLLEKTLKKVEFFYFNTPHNPTGKIFSEEEVTNISEMCKKNNVYLISDEAYEKIIYDDKKHFSPASLNLENIISCFTFSKTYSMTGFRLGYLATRDKKAAELLRLGNYTQTAGVVTFLQYAGAEALKNKIEGEKAVNLMIKEYKKRRDDLYDGLEKIKGIKINKPEGAFYMFPNFSEFMPKKLNGKKRDYYLYNLLMENGIGVVYGSCFGRGFEDNIRLSFSATPVSEIQEAVKRFRNLFNKN